MPELLHDLSWVLPLRHDWLTTLMHGFSYLGYEKFILFFLPLGYWAWNKAIFLRLFLLVAFTAVLNAWLKDLWQDPRPPLEYTWTMRWAPVLACLRGMRRSPWCCGCGWPMRRAAGCSTG